MTSSGGASPDRTGAPRVALVLASSTGGIGRHVASLADGLARRDFAVTVYGPAATNALFTFARRGVRFHRVEMPSGERPADPPPGAGRPAPAGTLTAAWALRRALRAPAPDVIHAHGLRAGLVADLARRLPLMPAGAPSARSPLAAVPLVVTWHNAVLADGLRGQVLRLAERRVARAADITLGASAGLTARARELGARDARLGEIAAPLLPPSRRDRGQVREELGVAPGQPLVLSVGRLHPQKGYPVLIEAAARWGRRRSPPPVVVIAGSGPDYLALAAQASAARAPVTLVGHRGDVADLLAAADVAVVTSVWEARQLFVQEALRAGVPLVATAVGALPELVGDAAVLVAPGSVDEVDTAVTKLLDDEALRRDLGRRGRLRARHWPTEEQTVQRVSDLYAELLTLREPAAGA
jgi:glycosyltransferase involved in cell wall biosynthesis